MQIHHINSVKKKIIQTYQQTEGNLTKFKFVPNKNSQKQPVARLPESYKVHTIYKKSTVYYIHTQWQKSMLPKIMRQPFHHCYSTVLEGLTSRVRQKKELPQTNQKRKTKAIPIYIFKNIHRILLERGERGNRQIKF